MRIRKSQKIALLVGWLGLITSGCRAQPLAFPGAEGYGRFSSGGRGGKVLAVTNLNDRGEGSLRAAVETAGARIIVFRVSGNIALESELQIKEGNLTIAGQTAPGDGICIKDYPVIIDADNVIIRFLRIRLGDVHKLQADALSVIFRKNIMIDHCSLSWGIDEVATVRDNINSTMQWCIISESLCRSYHSKGDHGYGGIWGGRGASFHHNLLAHNSSRNPRFNGSRYHGKPDQERVDFRNNVIYNWGFNSSYGGEGGSYNMVANYYKYGPASQEKNRIVDPWDASSSWYIADNFVYGFPAITDNNWAGGVQGEFRDRLIKAELPHSFEPVETQTAEEAYWQVLSMVGAFLPARDAVDKRIIEEVKNGTATCGRTGKGIIDSQSEVGGWPELLTSDVPADSDADGMPDTWELARNLNPLDPTDQNGDPDHNGYSSLEDYLNSLVSTQRPDIENYPVQK